MNPKLIRELYFKLVAILFIFSVSIISLINHWTSIQATKYMDYNSSAVQKFTTNLTHYDRELKTSQ